MGKLMAEEFYFQFSNRFHTKTCQADLSNPLQTLSTKIHHPTSNQNQNDQKMNELKDEIKNEPENQSEPRTQTQDLWNLSIRYIRNSFNSIAAIGYSQPIHLVGKLRSLTFTAHQSGHTHQDLTILTVKSPSKLAKAESD